MIVGTLTVVCVAAIGWVYLPMLYRNLSEVELPDLKALVQSKVTVQPLIADTELIVHWQSKKAIYYFKLSAIVDPDSPPYRDEICANSQGVYRQLLVNNSAPAGFGMPTVQFMARAWFDASDTYLFPSGKAHIADDGSWVCTFEYPVADSFNNQG